MKFTWFNLMPWPFLPDDFREKNRSVWVDIDGELYDPVRGHDVYNTYLDLLEYAEELGYDGIGVNEHHANAYGMMPSPNIMAATLARRTRKSALVVLGNTLPLYTPPIRVAEEMAMLDVISGGRLVSGFPVGSSMDVNYCYGQVPAEIREKYAEAHEFIIKAWQEQKAFAWNGRYSQLRYANCWVKPIQKPHPPIFVPGGGSIETWDFCVENDYSYSYLSFSGYMRGKQLLDGYWDRVDASGKDRSPYRAGFAQTICVARTDEEAEELYSDHVSYFFNRCLHIHPGFGDAPGYRTISTVKANVLPQFTRDLGNVFETLTWQNLIDAGFIIAGSPESVTEQMKEMIRGLHVGNIFCLIHVGDMPAEKTRYSMKLFAEEVIPNLRGMFPDHADDDRFWIHPLKERRQPGVSAPGRF